MKYTLKENIAQAGNLMRIFMITIKIIICKLNPAKELKYMIIKLIITISKVQNYLKIRFCLVISKIMRINIKLLTI